MVPHHDHDKKNHVCEICGGEADLITKEVKESIKNAFWVSSLQEIIGGWSNILSDELTELLETAMYKEIAAEAFYSAGQNNTDNAGAKSLMKELAEDELRHLEILKGLKDRDWGKGQWNKKEIPNLMISEHLTTSDKLEGTNLQGTLVIAMKREQQAVEFYSRMTSVLRDEEAKRLCERLVHEELKHKYRLELLYDDLFYGED